MNKARIYQPDKNPMQSGKGKTQQWVLEFMPETPFFTDSLMGWSGMNESTREVTLRFPSKEAAISFANKKNLDVDITIPNQRKERNKAYADNFSFNKVK